MISQMMFFCMKIVPRLSGREVLFLPEPGGCVTNLA